MKCAFVGCELLRSEKTQNSNISFHRIPRNENRKRLWLEAIGTENIRPNVKDIFLCSLHFDESAINKTLANKRLRDDAVPTLFAKPSGGGVVSSILQQRNPNSMPTLDSMVEMQMYDASTSVFNEPHELSDERRNIDMTLTSFGLKTVANNRNNARKKKT